MLRLIFLIILTSCEQILKVCDQNATSHVITFGFDTKKYKIATITDVLVSRINENGFSKEIPVKSIFFAQNFSSLNIVVENLLSDENCCRDFFHIAFYENEDSCVIEDVFEINKTRNGPLEICTKTLESANVYLAFLFNKYFEKIYKKYENFSIVPRNKILYDKIFVKNIKPMLENYFLSHRGLRQTVDLLNDCLSQVIKSEDIPVQLKKFFDERRKSLIELNSRFSALHGMAKFSFDVDSDFLSMMVDILIFLEQCTKIDCCFEFDFLLQNQNIASKIKEVKTFVIPDTFYKKKNSAIHLLIYPDVNLNLYYEKDIWFLKNKLYVSHDFCNTCYEKKWCLKVFNSKEKTKSMALELFEV